MTRSFKLVRDEDVTGVSGTGHIASGVSFSDGTAVLHWPGDPFTTTTIHSGGVESILHIHGHGGKTRLVWDDDSTPDFDEEDIEFLHEILAHDVAQFNTRAARRLLSKLKTSMGRGAIPNQKSIP